MRSSAREAKLHTLLFNHGEVHRQVEELVRTYQAFLAEDVHGTHLAHMVDMYLGMRKLSGCTCWELSGLALSR